MSRSRDGLEMYQRLVSVWPREKLPTSRSPEADVSVSSRSRPLTSRAQDSFLMGMQMAPYKTQCERALDVVSHAVVTIAHHTNTLKTMNVKDNI